jgi:tetratricopeptide (TPR) repeat protein
MLRGALVLLAVLAGAGFVFASEQHFSGHKQKQWEAAQKYLGEGKIGEAKAAFETLLVEYPNEPDLHLFLGITLLRSRDPESAEASIKKAIALDPGHAEARTLLGWIDSEIRGDFDAAIREYQRVVELRPDVPEAYNNLGVAQKRKGALEQAADSFNQALRRRPDYSAALSNRGWVLAAQNQWDDARRDFESALKIDPRDDGALYGLSHALREGRDYAGAQKVLGQLISRSPNFVYWLEWGRIGLIRYYWVLLLITMTFFLKGRFKKARSEVNAG